MRFSFAVVSAISFTGLALCAVVRSDPNAALRPGKVPMIKPAAWGSTKAPGNQIPHPAIVIDRHRGTATVAQLTHKPIPGQHFIETGHVAPSLDKQHNGKKSYIDLKTHNVNVGSIRAHHGNKVDVIGTTSSHELANVKGAVHQASLKRIAQKAVVAKTAHKSNMRKVVHQAVADTKHKAAIKSAAHAGAKNGRVRNARLGHHAW